MRKFTVVLYIDGDKGVETFAIEVEAATPGDAWPVAVAKGLADELTSSGYPLDSDDWQQATEIATFNGWNLSAYLPLVNDSAA